MSAHPNAGLMRRLGAIVYDTLLVIAVLVAVTFLFLPFLDGRVLVPAEVGELAYLYRALQAAAVVLFFGFFWTRRGQTIGMVAWRLRIESLNDARVRWAAVLRRLALLFLLSSPFFLGHVFVWRDWPDGAVRTLAVAASLLPLVLSYAWVWVDRERLAWHDRWSGTRIVLLPKS